MYYYKYYFFIIFIILIIINFINCQVTPITDQPIFKISDLTNGTQKYYGYPSVNNNYQCLLYLEFLAEDISENNINSKIDVRAYLNVSNDFRYFGGVAKEIGNGFSYFAISYYYLPNPPNQTFPISTSYIKLDVISNYSITNTFQIQYQCFYPDTSNASLYIMQDAPMLNFLYGALYTIKVDGLNFDFQYFDDPYIQCFRNNVFLVYLYYNDYKNYNNDTIDRTFVLWDKTFPITFKNPFKSNEIVTIDQITTYPSITTSDIVEYGSGYKPFNSFRSNSSLYSPLQIGEPDNVIIIPLKGNKGNMTYAFQFYGSGEAGTYYTNKIDYYNGSTFDSISFNVSSSKYFYPETIPSAVLITYSNSSLFQVSMFKHSVSIISNHFPILNFKINDFSLSLIKPFPFGHVYGNNNNYTNEVAFQIEQKMKTNLFYMIDSIGFNGFEYDGSVRFDNTIVYQTDAPLLLWYEFNHIIGTTYLIRLGVYDKVGLYHLVFYDKVQQIGSTLIKGDEFNGTHEIVFDMSLGIDLKMVNTYGFTRQYSQGTPIISTNPLVLYESSTYVQLLINYIGYSKFVQMDTESILDVSFLYNNISVKDEACHNIVYIKPNLNKISKSNGIKFNIRANIELLLYPIYVSSWNAVWDENQGMFIAKFIIPKGYIFGNIHYSIILDTKTIIFNFLLPSKSQLIVNSTDYYDIGPYFSNIKKLPSDSVLIEDAGVVLGWRVTIKEDYYGFSKGYIKVIGSIDNSIYHFNFTLSNATTSSSIKFESVYDILINITSPCFSQDYVIEIVELEGINGVVSKFGISDQSPDSLKNPFKLFLTNPFINRINSTCSININDTSPPSLIDFIVNTNSVDVSSSNRLVTFNFNATDKESGLKNGQYPVVYLISKKMDSIECVSKIVQITELTASYECSVILPYGFGYPGSLVISVYGFINNGGYYSGFTSFDLQSFSLPYYINTTLVSRSPFIRSNEPFFSDSGNDLVLYGSHFEDVENVYFKFSESEPFKAVPSTTNFSSVLIFKNFNQAEKPFTVKVVTKNLIESNEYTVNPIYFDAKISTPTPEPTSEPSPEPTPSPEPPPSPEPTPTPTTSPITQCPGTPEPCGGSKRGYCNTDNGKCSCFSPWVGISCNSQTIILSKPSTNTSEPTIEIPTTNSNTIESNDKTEKILFKSLISMVSLRELDYNDNLVNQNPFDKWIFSKVDDNKNLYTTNITSTTNISVQLEWFTDESQVLFGDFNLTMNPSTIKYTIEINEYEFKNSLNKLQLVMSASFSSSKSNDICSSKQFDNDDDDSDYLKIQIDNQSLYGRFIKRAILDGKPKTIENVLLDSSFNSDSDSSSFVQSFIGITIPWYKSKIIIDPDFSILLDSNSVSSSNSNNAICNLSKNGLTTAQLAGIIIASVAFAAVIIIGSVYVLYKRKQSNNFKSKLINLKNLY